MSGDNIKKMINESKMLILIKEWDKIKKLTIKNPIQNYSNNDKYCMLLDGNRDLQLLLMKKYTGNLTECKLCKTNIHSYLNHVHRWFALNN